MDPINFDGIGNLRDDFKYEPQHVMSVGLLTSPSLVLKMYQMAKEMPFSWDRMVDAKKFLAREIEQGRVAPLTGLGFAILSKDMLNVARWDTEHPIVIKNQIYGVPEYTEEHLKLLGQKSAFDSAELLDLGKVGPFCIWELGIVNWERNAWKKYLQSKRTETDKWDYLESTIEGHL